MSNINIASGIPLFSSNIFKVDQLKHDGRRAAISHAENIIQHFRRKPQRKREREREKKDSEMEV
jgi:hypothetical protein